MGKICKSCNKKEHFARCCNSTKKVNNVDNESVSTVEKDINFIRSDSEPEFDFLKIPGTSHQLPISKASPREHLFPAKQIISVPKLISIRKLDVINSPSRKIRVLQVTLRVITRSSKAL